jgi:eukaryotic-like serine/threonine-protein kinase
MGWVYAAHDGRLDTRVALKVLDARSPLSAKQTARFVREARVAAQVESEHIAKALDFGVCDEHEVPFIAFELLQGADLEKVLEQEGHVPVERAVDYVLQASVGLAAAHVEGIAHRDLKPANLFRVDVPGKASVIKVLDFGIAKALKGREIGRGPSTATGEVFGTPLYMAPEQLRDSKHVDERADIWSLGAILYELLAGAPPFQGKTLAELVVSVFDGAIVPLERRRAGIPPPLGAAVLRCLERRREQRFQSVREVARVLAPFGSPVGREALEQIEEVFLQNTERRPSDGELDATLPHDGPALASTMRLGHAPPGGRSRGTSRPSRGPSVRYVLAVVLGLVTLLAAAGAVGFLLARGG